MVNTDVYTYICVHTLCMHTNIDAMILCSSLGFGSLDLVCRIIPFKTIDW